MSLLANFRKSHALAIRPLDGALLGAFSPHSPKAGAPNRPGGTRMAILEIDLVSSIPLYSHCLTLLGDTAYSFVEGIFRPCADRTGVARG